MPACNLNPYGLRGGRVVDVEDLNEETEYGLRCNCKCPRCGENLVARIRGTKREKHFAHKGGADCGGGYETAIHLLAKEIIEEGVKITLPPVISSFSNEGFFVSNDTIKYPAIISKGYLVDTNKLKVVAEEDYGTFRPDITVYISEEKKLFIEILVTHPVSEDKKKLITDLRVSCIEVDFSKMSDVIITKDDIRSALEGINRDVSIKWIHNEKKAELDSDISSHCSEYLILSSNDNSICKGMHFSELGFRHEIIDGETVLNCPDKRVFDGKEFLAYVVDCRKCEFHQGMLSQIGEKKPLGMICTKGDNDVEVRVEDVTEWLANQVEMLEIPDSYDDCIKAVNNLFSMICPQLASDKKVVEAESIAKKRMIQRKKEKEKGILYESLHRELNRLIYYAYSQFDGWQRWAYRKIAESEITILSSAAKKKGFYKIFYSIANKVWKIHLKEGQRLYYRDLAFRNKINSLLQFKKYEQESLDKWLYRIINPMLRPTGHYYYSISYYAKKDFDFISVLPFLSKKAQELYIDNNPK